MDANLVARVGDGTLSLIRVSDGRLLATVIVRKNNLILVSSDGLFDGDISDDDLIAFDGKFNPISSSELMFSRHRRGLLADILGSIVA
jgi:hypothetical protein